MKLTPFDLNSIKSQCYQNIEYYQDNRTIAYNYSTQYICGRIDGSVWISELMASYLDLDIVLCLEILNLIAIKKLDIQAIDNDYKRGLYDQLVEMEIKINDRVN